jgi:hypothetical protein
VTARPTAVQTAVWLAELVFPCWFHIRP